MESSAPPDNQGPLSTGDLFSGMKSNLTEWSDCSQTSTKLPEGKYSREREFKEGHKSCGTPRLCEDQPLERGRILLGCGVLQTSNIRRKARMRVKGHFFRKRCPFIFLANRTLLSSRSDVHSPFPFCAKIRFSQETVFFVIVQPKYLL